MEGWKYKLSRTLWFFCADITDIKEFFLVYVLGRFRVDSGTIIHTVSCKQKALLAGNFTIS